MNLDLRQYINSIKPDTMFQLANAVPDGEMLWATFLPEREHDKYTVRDSQMVVYSTMAGMVGRDSPYAPGGVLQASDFQEDIIKWSIEAALGENQLILLQELAQKVEIGAASTDALVETLLNFSDKVIAQSLRDGMEYARARALQDGALSWTFNQKTISVSYGIPGTNTFDRTTQGKGDWRDTQSTFWADIEEIRQLMQRRVLAIVMTENTLTKIVNQNANKLQVTEVAKSRYSSRYRLSRVAQTGYANVVPEDYRSSVEIITYDRIATAYDPQASDLLKHLPFMDDDKVVILGQPNGIHFEVGSTELPEHALGYTHVGPTVENGGTPGRWMRLYTPESQPWRLVGQGVTNALPVIREPRRVAIVSLNTTAP